jgi:hypothetical protein
MPIIVIPVYIYRAKIITFATKLIAANFFVKAPLLSVP